MNDLFHIGLRARAPRARRKGFVWKVILARALRGGMLMKPVQDVDKTLGGNFGHAVCMPSACHAVVMAVFIFRMMCPESCVIVSPSFA